jgi:hypothetical protein
MANEDDSHLQNQEFVGFSMLFGVEHCSFAPRIVTRALDLLAIFS